MGEDTEYAFGIRYGALRARTIRLVPRLGGPTASQTLIRPLFGAPASSHTTSRSDGRAG